MHSSIAPAPAAVLPKFPKDSAFQTELHRRVDEHFAVTGKAQRDCPKMYLKSSIILLSFVVSYIVLVFVPMSWWLLAPVATWLALSVSAIGFNIQHDAGHRAYSRYTWVNKVMSWTLDIIGGSSYMWHWKHGVFHHTYTNIAGHDSDIELGILGRLCPHQKRYFFHRWQHYYLWPLYGLVVVKWHLWDDFHSYVTGRIGEHRFPRPKGWDLLIFIVGKLLFLTIAFVIPMLVNTWWLVLLTYLYVSVVTGMVLSVVFQLAHCDEAASFPLPDDASHRMEQGWAVHQAETTVDFAPRSRLLTWLLGGLNFQIEHHLFPRICHTNYPAIAKIVEQVCRDFGVAYNVHGTFWSAMRAHFLWLRQMGQAPALA